MKIDNISVSNQNVITALLTSKAFAENARLTYPLDGAVPDRLSYLTDIVRTKRIIHLGFCDHLPSIAERRKNKRWLHDLLCASASHCVGIDIDQRAVDFVSQTLGLKDVHCIDICAQESKKLIEGGSWDFLVAAEVLEHIGDPVSFLRSIKALHRSSIRQLIVTVPNATRAGSIRAALHGQEVINSDHRFYFTPYTLLKVCTDAGLRPRELLFAKFSETSGVRGRLKNFILGRFPLLSENIVVVADL